MSGTQRGVQLRPPPFGNSGQRNPTAVTLRRWRKFFCDLEPVIRDLERAAKISERLDRRPGRREEIELGRFAVSQFRAMASDLVRLWSDKHEAGALYRVVADPFREFLQRKRSLRRLHQQCNSRPKI